MMLMRGVRHGLAMRRLRRSAAHGLPYYHQGRCGGRARPGIVTREQPARSPLTQICFSAADSPCTGSLIPIDPDRTRPRHLCCRM
jgi:hypothetical protein